MRRRRRKERERKTFTSHNVCKEEEKKYARVVTTGRIALQKKKKNQETFFLFKKYFRSIHWGRRRSEWPTENKRKREKETVKKIALTGLVTQEGNKSPNNMRKIELDRERVTKKKGEWLA